MNAYYQAVALAAGVVVGVARLLFSAEWSGHGAPVGALLVVLCGLRLLWVMESVTGGGDL